MIKARTGINVDISSGKESLKISGKEGGMTVGTSASWPADLPTDVPKFTAGQITMAVKSGNNWTVIIKEVKKEETEEYLAQLQKNGWVSENEVDFVVDLSQMEKGNYRLTLAYDASSNGVSLTVSEKTQGE